jgi:hypothetical protein
MSKLMHSIVRGVAALLLAGSVAQAAAPASAQSLSDDSVLKLMNYAWQQLPTRFTKPDGQVVEIDKKQQAKVVVPVDVAREVIIAGRRTALAQICNLEEHMVNNYRSLMARQLDSKRWNEQQIVYINVLHLTVLQIFTGDMAIKEEQGGDKKLVEIPLENKRKQSCSDAEAKKLKDQIDTYIAQGPKLLEPTPEMIKKAEQIEAARNAALEAAAKAQAAQAPVTTGSTGATPAAAGAPAPAAAPAPQQKKR